VWVSKWLSVCVRKLKTVCGVVGSAGSQEPYITEEERTAFCSTLEKTEDWLYDEGEDETKGVYSAKLESLQAVGNPVIQRLEEAGTRDGAAATLDTVCACCAARVLTGIPLPLSSPPVAFHRSINSGPVGGLD
jgi:hypothetical protein